LTNTSANTAPDTPQLLALDWGTSSLRAFLIGRGGAVLDTRHAAWGIQHLPAPREAGGFEQAFASIAGEWLREHPALPGVACGMVGSAQGWKEAAYVRCPADVRELAHHAAQVASGLGPEVLIAPGVLFDRPGHAPDVMRGEEIQIAGALAVQPALAQRACVVLPGTHSKWAWIEHGRISGFSTYMTGELFAVLVRHSILGRLMPADSSANADAAESAFSQGIEAARNSSPGDLPHQLFATRTLGLTGRLPANALGEYLSGLLIGHELISGLASTGAQRDANQPLILVGEPHLCGRYVRAFAQLGAPIPVQLENTAPRGLWEFARAAKLIH